MLNTLNVMFPYDCHSFDYSGSETMLGLLSLSAWENLPVVPCAIPSSIQSLSPPLATAGTWSRCFTLRCLIMFAVFEENLKVDLHSLQYTVPLFSFLIKYFQAREQYRACIFTWLSSSSSFMLSISENTLPVQSTSANGAAYRLQFLGSSMNCTNLCFIHSLIHSLQEFLQNRGVLWHVC